MKKKPAAILFILCSLLFSLLPQNALAAEPEGGMASLASVGGSGQGGEGDVPIRLSVSSAYRTGEDTIPALYYDAVYGVYSVERDTAPVWGGAYTTALSGNYLVTVDAV